MFHSLQLVGLLKCVCASELSADTGCKCRKAVVWEHLGVACNLLCIFCLFVFQSAEVG